jgi:hypothetical protein
MLDDATLSHIWYLAPPRQCRDIWLNKPLKLERSTCSEAEAFGVKVSGPIYRKKRVRILSSCYWHSSLEGLVAWSVIRHELRVGGAIKVTVQIHALGARLQALQ